MAVNKGLRSSQGLKYPYDEHPAKGTTMEVAEGVRWLTMPMWGSLTHINLYLLEDDDGWFVVDTGLGTDDTKKLWHTIFDSELNGKPVKGVICTHMHPDHIGQAGMITEHFRVPLFMTRGEFYQARSFATGGPSHHSSWIGQEFYTQYGMPADYLQKLSKMWTGRATGKMSMMSMPTAFPSGFHRLEDGDVLSIGNHHWEIVVGSGHSPEHACLLCRSLKIMISGDQILPIITSNVSVHPTEPEANPLKAWMESHDKLLSTPEDTFVLPAHNLPFFGVRERLRQLINHHEERMLALEEFCVEPQTANALLPVLFKRKLDPGQAMMALGEAIAHCHLLMYRDRIERTLHEDGAYRFTATDPAHAREPRLDTRDDVPTLA